jgi:hypothetical protein
MMPKPTITSIKIINKLAVAKSFTIIFIQGSLPLLIDGSKSYANNKEKCKLVEIKEEF